MASTLKWFNVGLRALMELGIIIALGYWGYKTGSSASMKILWGTGARHGDMVGEIEDRVLT